MSTTENPIILQTPRLILRQFALIDTEFIINLLNSPGWLQFIGNRNVRTEDEARNYLLNGPLKSYRENGFGLALVELKSSEIPIGMCGLLKRDYLKVPDIGFAFLGDHIGMGYAFEIARATLDHAREVYKIDHVMAITMPGNEASIRLLKKLGLKFSNTISSPAGEELMVFGN